MFLFFCLVIPLTPVRSLKDQETLRSSAPFLISRALFVESFDVLRPQGEK